MGIRFSAALFLSLFCFDTYLVVATFPAYAGFEFGKSEGPTVQAQQGMTYNGKGRAYVTPHKQMAEGNMPQGAEGQVESAPSFEVYQDRYLPDSVKKKYGLTDDWYQNKSGIVTNGQVKDKAASPTTQPITLQQPTSLRPTNAGVENMPIPLFARAPKELLRELQNIPPFAPNSSVPVSSAPSEREGKDKDAQKNITNIEPAAGLGTVVVEGKARNYTQSWRARKGENFRDVLRRWSERENTELMWASPENPVLDKDFSFFGKYQDAVARLMATSISASLHSQYRSEGLAPTMMTPAAIVATNQTLSDPEKILLPQEGPLPITSSLDRTASQARSESSLSHIYMPAAEKKVVRETRWLGLTGAPMSEVLRVWSEDAGVNLIWQSENDYALRGPVSKVGTYEEAIYAALSQYDDMPMRPVGEIYRDPQSGQVSLIVRDDSRF